MRLVYKRQTIFKSDDTDEISLQAPNNLLIWWHWWDKFTSAKQSFNLMTLMRLAYNRQTICKSDDTDEISLQAPNNL